MLELKCVTKDYYTKQGSIRALNNVSLVFPNKGLVAIYGENGCGKTTLLNSISLLDSEFDGEILYNGKNIKSFADLYRKNNVSVVLQENSFVDYLNITDNIDLFCDEKSHILIAEKLKEFDIPEKGLESPLCVSGGQKQRVSLIRGLSKRYRVLLVDEPTSSLNEAMEKEVFETLQTIAKERLVVLVSHTLFLIRQYANMVIFMDKGSVKSVEYLGGDDIIYRDDIIEVPSTIQNFGILNTNKVKRMINEKGGVKITYCSGQRQAFVPDYSHSNEVELDTIKKMSPYLKNKIIRLSLLSQKRKLAGFAALIIVFSVLMGLLFCLAYFDNYSFAYSSIKNNVTGLVNFRELRSYGDTMSYFSQDTYKQMKKNYSSKLIIRKCFDYYSSLDFIESGIYSPDILSFSFCTEEDVSVIAGHFADNTAVMITDYLADGLVLLDNQYSNIDSILSNGINLGGIHLSVQGIIDTDYERYKGVFDSEIFSRSQEYIDYQQSIQLYRSIFFPVNSESLMLELSVVPVEYGEQYAKVVLINEDDMQSLTSVDGENVCLVSPALYSKYSESSILKITNDYLIVGGYKEAETNENTIYLTSETYQKVVQNEFANISVITIDIQKEEEIEFLEAHGMQHNTSMSGYIYRVIDIITVLQKMFVVLLVAFFVASLICSVGVLTLFLENDKRLIGFMRIVGYPPKTIWGIEISKALIFVLITSFLAEISLCGCAFGINAALSHLFKYSISIFDMNVLSCLMVMADLIVSFAIAVLGCKKSFKTQIINLVK